METMPVLFALEFLSFHPANGCWHAETKRALFALHLVEIFGFATVKIQRYISPGCARHGLPGEQSSPLMQPINQPFPFPPGTLTNYGVFLRLDPFYRFAHFALPGGHFAWVGCKNFAFIQARPAKPQPLLKP